MITYNKIYKAIELNNGSLIYFIMDKKDKLNYEFINGLKEDFSFDYKYIEYTPDLDIQNINEKSIIIIDYDKKINRDKLIGNKNVIVILLMDYYRTSNTEISGTATKHLSNLIFILKDSKLKILKSRLPNIIDTKIDKIVHIMKLLRKIKLNLITKK